MIPLAPLSQESVRHWVATAREIHENAPVLRHRHSGRHRPPKRGHQFDVARGLFARQRGFCPGRPLLRRRVSAERKNVGYEDAGQHAPTASVAIFTFCMFILRPRASPDALRFDPQNTAAIIVRQQIEKPVRPLDDVTNSFLKIAQVALFLSHTAII
jgi:hypothetical protein